MSLTDDFCETFKAKEDCNCAMGGFFRFGLPLGVDENDARVKQIVQWSHELFDQPPE
jgi:hypothetical protein